MATADDLNSVGESEEEIEQAEDESVDDAAQPEIFTLKLLLVIKNAQQSHGLRHGDYQCYRSYCSRRIRRIRKMLHFVQGNKKTFRRKDVTDEVLTNEKYLYIPLMNIERAWSYCMQLKQEATTEQRKRFHLISRLRKAAKLAEQLETLCVESARCDARTKLEVQAYAAFIAGSLAFEQRSWTQAIQCFTRSQTIYEKLASALSEDEAVVYRARADEMTPSLRFCAYFIGDEQAGKELASIRLGQNELLDSLLKETRADQAAALSHVTWRGRTVSVQHEKVRSFLLSEQQLNEQLQLPDCDQLQLFDSYLMDCKDAIHVLREELRQDPAFKMYSYESGSQLSAQHYLYTYLCYLRVTATVRRNLVIVDNMRRTYQQKQKSVDGRRVRLQDIVRLYEMIVQSLLEVPSLAGLEHDSSVEQTVSAQLAVYRAFRCYYIGQGYASVEKWTEALMLYERADEYLSNSTALESCDDKDIKCRVEELTAELQVAKCMVQAQRVLAQHQQQQQQQKGQKKATAGKTGHHQLNNTGAGNTSLLSRMDTYMDDITVASGCLIELPPAMLPLPCKPLFFDLSLNHLQLPDISEEAGVSAAAAAAAAAKTASSAASGGTAGDSTAGSGGGLTGLVRGLWGGWGNKK